MKSLRMRWRCSIRWRYTCIFISLMLALLLAIMGINTFFLERYYSMEKVSVMEQAYNSLDNMIKAANRAGISLDQLFPEDYDASDSSSGTAATEYIRSLAETSNISVVIMDTETDRSFAASLDEDFIKHRLSEYIFGSRTAGDGRVVRSFQNYRIEENMRYGSSGGYLESWGYFSDNRTCFIMSMPLSSLHESVRFFNRFLLSIGSLVLVLGAAVMYFATKKITEPINSLANLSERMTKLDFSARYTGSNEDELGTLGRSMNSLSERLETAIAELKTANNELQSDIENKRLIDQKRQEFVANVSHELKTPIALIQGYAEGLQDGLCEDPESRDYYCGVIVDEAKKMNRMVRQLLNLSAIEQGKDAPDFTRFNLSKVVKGVVAAADILVKQKEASVELDVPESINVWADEFKIEEVITNYLNNALNHLQAPNQISIYTEAEGENTVSIHVMNTGKQIPEEDLNKLWEKFYKVDKAHTRAYGGSGLGLSIVRAIADAHHQRCGVKNTRTGVDFWFTLEQQKDSDE